MLSAVLYSIHSYPAYPIGIRTGRPEVCSSKSSRIMEKSFQYSIANRRYRPNCLFLWSFISESKDYTFIFFKEKELPYYNHRYLIDDYLTLFILQSCIRAKSTKSLRGQIFFYIIYMERYGKLNPFELLKF